MALSFMGLDAPKPVTRNTTPSGPRAIALDSWQGPKLGMLEIVEGMKPQWPYTRDNPASDPSRTRAHTLSTS